MHNEQAASYHDAERCPGTLTNSDSWGKCEKESSALFLLQTVPGLIRIHVRQSAFLHSWSGGEGGR